ncbi:unnamed protein product [Brachionus calyciflorus]|uniref:Uncharacterized protein n=1 Tax=Brachionus calyciflorus TaxID=104777 RepID=A0A814MFH7_9BILA|nr:unnamed protein product [Brachionus calyciflorus]
MSPHLKRISILDKNKNRISILQLSESSEKNPRAVKRILENETDSDSEIYQIIEAKIRKPEAKAKKTEPKSKKEEKEDQLVEIQLEQFKKHYDLKINNYFKQLHETLLRLVDTIDKSLDEFKSLKKVLKIKVI